MENKIRIFIDQPGELEKLYRENRSGFKQAFSTLYPDLKDQILARYWYERLYYPEGQIFKGKGLGYILIAGLISGLLTQIPGWFSLTPEEYFARHTGFIVFIALAGYYLYKSPPNRLLMVTLFLLTIVLVLYVNLIPGNLNDDVFALICMHVPVLLWGITGIAYMGQPIQNSERRLSYLKFMGDLIVISTVLGLSGLILSGLTVGLFEVIGLNIENFYYENIALFFLPWIPILGVYLIDTNPELVGKISPVIAKIFSPLVLMMLIAYLAAILISDQSLYHDREYLLMYNILLIGVMAIILFSIAERSDNEISKPEKIILFLLSMLTIVINTFALSAIVFRISNLGIAPNRLAVLGANVLMLSNLLMVSIQFIRIWSGQTGMLSVHNAISRYLPVYLGWALVVALIFPLLF